MTIPRLIFVFGFFLLSLGTGQETGITGKDEFWVTFRTPMEMIERDSYWTLWLHDEVRLEKPPLVYWAICVFYKAFGIHVRSARLVGVLCGGGLAAVTAMLYRRLFGKPGFLAGMLVLATAGLAVEGRRAMLDIPLGFFSLCAVYAAVAAWQDRKLAPWIWSGVWLAAATMAKGPQSLIFVGSALAAGLLFAPGKRPWGFLVRGGLLGTAVFLLLALPWPLSMVSIHGDYLAELSEQMVKNRFGEVNPASPLTALTGAVLLSFPWSVVLLSSLALAWRKGHALNDRRIHWLIGWYILSVTPFFFMRSFERYMIPILPCTALLATVTLERVQAPARRFLLRLSCGLLALFGILLSLFALWFHLSFWIAIASLTLIAWMLHTAWRAERLDRPVVAAAWVFAMVLGAVYPRLHINELPDDLPWAELRQHPVGIYSQFSQPAMLSMRLQRSVDFSREDRLVARGYDGYIFTTREQLDDPERPDTLRRALNDARIPYEVVGRFRTFYSRKAWIRFTRPDATRADWIAALRARDLESLKSELVYVRTGKLVQAP
jgi:4-amino-4-deoxy-L-arabinose transferase-like glycosyltransferase